MDTLTLCTRQPRLASWDCAISYVKREEARRDKSTRRNRSTIQIPKISYKKPSGSTGQPGTRTNIGPQPILYRAQPCKAAIT